MLIDTHIAQLCQNITNVGIRHENKCIIIYIRYGYFKTL